MMFSFFRTLELPLIISFVIAILATVALSLTIEVIVYQPLVNKNTSLNIIMISSLGVMIIVINTIAMFYGNETKILNPDISESYTFGNILITYTQLYQLVTSVLIIGIFMLFLKYSNFGIRTRAMRDDSTLCKVFGMDIKRMRLYLFALSALFAAVGSGLIAYDVGFDPYIGMPMLLNVVVALIIGGIGRFEAPVLGGFIIGLLQALTVWVFSARWQDAITFVLLILFLLLRPQGLLGEKQRAV